MSFSEKDRKIRSKAGKVFPPDGLEDAGKAGKAGFVASIATALKREFGGTNASIKKVVALTGANERAVKNWFGGKNGPSGEHLISLMQHSEMVLEVVLMMAGRQELAQAKKFVDARAKLAEMLSILDELQRP